MEEIEKKGRGRPKLPKKKEAQLIVKFYERDAEFLEVSKQICARAGISFSAEVREAFINHFLPILETEGKK